MYADSISLLYNLHIATVSVSPSVSVGEGDTNTVCVALTGASSATVISDPITVTLTPSQNNMSGIWDMCSVF